MTIVRNACYTTIKKLRSYESPESFSRKFTAAMNYLAVSELGEKELREFTEMIEQIVPPMK